MLEACKHGDVFPRQLDDGREFTQSVIHGTRVQDRFP